MERYYEKFDGKEFPVRFVQVPKQWEISSYCTIEVADVELWAAIEYDYNNENSPLHSEAVAIDNDIFFYCDSGFIASNPTDEQIIKHLERWAM